MPLVRIDIPKGKMPEQERAISQGIQAALVETFDVPKDDLFQIISARPPTEMMHAPAYLGLEYSQDLTVIHLTVSDTRTLEQKKRCRPAARRHARRASRRRVHLHSA